MAGNQDTEAHRHTYLEGKSELSGLSESEHTGGLENLKTPRPNRQGGGEGSIFKRKLTDTGEYLGGVIVEA